MANTFFQFKEFTVHQEHCAMKVCTDACLFGAWVASCMMAKAPKTILDIGAGTGLLSLMLSQKTDAKIDAVEIDASAAMQARENFQKSKWTERLNIISADAKQLRFNNDHDLLICNPPFFKNDLKSSQSNNRLARHEDQFTLDHLFEISKTALQPEGTLAVLLPFSRLQEIQHQAKENGFSIFKICTVKQTPNHTGFRIMVLMQQKKSEKLEVGELEIKNAEGSYSEGFQLLLKDYYLQF